MKKNIKKIICFFYVLYIKYLESKNKKNKKFFLFNTLGNSKCLLKKIKKIESKIERLKNKCQ